jgi:hypothetical protein
MEVLSIRVSEKERAEAAVLVVWARSLSLTESSSFQTEEEARDQLTMQAVSSRRAS